MTFYRPAFYTEKIKRKSRGDNVSSYHQGDPRYAGNGRQCMANSLQCILKARTCMPSKWTQETLDEILDHGDKFYSSLMSRENKSYLSLDDIPSHIDGVGLHISQSFNGTLSLKHSEPPFLTLEDALDKMMVQKSHLAGYIFTMGSSQPFYTSTIIQEGDQFCFFDPHSRSETGMLAADGFACLTFHKHPKALCLFIRHLAASLTIDTDIFFECAELSMNAQLFQNVESVDVTETDDCSESDFSGFTSSDGELTACKLSLAQEKITNLEALDVSDVSSIYLTDTSDSEQSIDSNVVEQFIESLNDSASFLQGVNVEAFDHFNDVNENGNEGDDENDDMDNDNENCTVENSDIYTSDDDLPLSKLAGLQKDADGQIDDDLPLSKLRQCIQNGVSFAGSRESDNDNDFPLPVSDNDTPSTEPLPYDTPLHTNNPTSSMNDPVLSPHSENDCTSGTDPLSDIENDPNSENTGAMRGRKRKRNPISWKRNVMKKRRNEGLSYLDSAGRVKKAKMMGPGCGSKCRYKCHKNIGVENRQNIFHSYYRLNSLENKRHFILRNTLQKPKKLKTKSVSRRTKSYDWFLPNTDGGQVKVCKTFFPHTISVIDRMIRTVHEKANVAGISQDMRGRHEYRPNKINQEQKQRVRDHINSYETVESHYCRKDSKKLYLPSDLSVARMHKSYETDCIRDRVIPVKESYYREIFNNDFNLAFHKPLKDQCDLCNSFKNTPDSEKEKLQHTIDRHLKNKDLARKSKLSDKKLAKSNPNMVVAFFDLQEILLTPNAFENSMYYKRRLNTYNFTVYDMSTKYGYCYLWHESIASRGGCEIASCVYQFIELMSKRGKRDFIFYSDNCTAQNKNRFYVTMLWYAIHKFNLNSVTHKYLEKGHTMNEGDSIHSTIERATCDRKPIYSPAEWAATIRMARVHGQSYTVREMSLGDFYNFRDMSLNIKNFETNIKNLKLYWNTIKVLKLGSDNANQFEYQTDYDGEPQVIDLFHKLRLREIPHPLSLSLKQLRKEYIKIPWLKYVDLVGMCKKNIVPCIHHAFYLLLPHEAPCKR